MEHLILKDEQENLEELLDHVSGADCGGVCSYSCGQDCGYGCSNSCTGNLFN